MKAAATVGVLGGLVFGFASGAIAAAQHGIHEQFGASPFDISVVATALLVGALFGALGTTRLYGPLGARWAIAIAALIVLIGSIASATIPVGPLRLLIVSRLITGVGVGILTVAAPQYLSEMAPPRLRGALVSAYQLLVATGILVSYLVGLLFAGLDDGWRWMFLTTIVPAVALIVCLPFASDTPSRLLDCGRVADARGMLAATNPDADPEHALAVLRGEFDQEEPKYSELLAPNVRRALTIAVVMAAAQALTGITAIMYYAPTIFEISWGSRNESSAIIATVAIGAVNVAATAVAVKCVDRFGRRPLLIGGLSVMLSSALTLAVVGGSGGSGDTVGVITMAAVCAFVIGFELSLGPISWLLISEVFPARVRSPGISVGVATSWACNIIVALTFLVILDAIGAGWSFAIFAATTVATLAFVIRYVPETSGKTLEQISEQLSLASSGSHPAGGKGTTT